MKRVVHALVLAVALHTSTLPLSAAEPLVGLWRLQQQEIDGKGGDAIPHFADLAGKEIN